MSDEFVRVARVADVAPGTGTRVVVGGREIALFHVGGAFYALANACPHRGGPLCDGTIAGTSVSCPLHGWTFGLADGRMPYGDLVLLDSFAVRVEGEHVAICRTPRPR